LKIATIALLLLSWVGILVSTKVRNPIATFADVKPRRLSDVFTQLCLIKLSHLKQSFEELFTRRIVMQLTYRGISYQFSSKETRKSTVSSISGKYRGVPVRIESFQTEYQPNTSVQLKYRGIIYFGSINYEKQASRS
jgi:hypothetical protein